MKKIMHKISTLMESDYYSAIVLKSIGALTTLIYVVIFSRYVGPTIKGEIDVVLNYAGIFSIVFGFGIHESYPGLKKSGNSIDKRYFKCINTLFCVYVLVSMLGFIVSRSFSIFTICIITTLQIYGAYTSIVFTVIQPKKYLFFSIICDICMIIIIGVVYLSFNSSFIVAGWLMFAKETVHLLFIFFGLGYVPLKHGLSFTGLWTLIKSSLVSMVALLLMTLNYKIDVLMLEGNVSYADIGIYTLGVSLVSKLWLVPDAIKQMLTSKLTKGFGKEEVNKALKTSLMWCGALAIIIVVLGKPVINLLFGQPYSEAYTVMLYMLVGILGMVFYKIIYAYNVVLGKRIINMMILFVASITNILFNYYLIPLYGINGAAFSSVVSYLICGFMFFVIFKFETRQIQ